MSSVLEIKAMETPLRTMIRVYIKRASEIELYLSKKPKEWGKFQAEFNTEMNGIFRNIMNFEKFNLANGNEDKVYKLKQLFVKRFRKTFARGIYCDWSIRKPFGYAGDFKIMEDIYENNPITIGFDRLFDNYFQMSAISVAVRNRKEDFKRLLINFIQNKQNSTLRIMNLASGPCRELREILPLNNLLYKKVTFDCYDNDEKALEYSKNLLTNFYNINFIKANAVKIALKKEISDLINKRYDLIYSTGLLDYFSDRVAITLIRNLKKVLKPNGLLAISNVRDKYSNPSVHFMEWAGDWNLVYRDDDTFRQIFIDAGFKEGEFDTQYEQQGIIQYIIAFNKQK
ncbi:MAG: class I SAM-dependent methyltransferase [Candidatus Omnitrophota bacterium]|nr:class I SAM-dependent methyltransferase [Candidatus Omnitrophota bacterium]